VRGEYGYHKVILSGFSFEITHAYADNPLVRARGSPASKHAETDVAVLERISERHGNLLTTEPVVAERTGIPLILTEVTGQISNAQRRHAL
jgi:hypothetical protein